MPRHSFTILELVFLIVVIGIITAAILPRIDRDNVHEAAQQVISHIKYTQHLAMIDNVYDDTDPNWFSERWQISFYGCGGYVVYSDTNQAGGPNRAEAADDPLSRKKIFTTNTCTESTLDFPNVRLSDYYNIDNISFSAGCGGQSIMFDHLGRPYSANTINGVMKQNCDITLNSEKNTTGAVVRIVPETGYAYLLSFF